MMKYDLLIMKKILLTLSMFLCIVLSASAQKVALVDMEYIMKNIPAYEAANEQLSLVSKKWQKEVEAMLTEVQTMYKNYQTELVFMSEDMKVKREEEIIAKEKEANALRSKYFGQEGELFKKRESLIKPIQDEVYTAVQELAKEAKYELILDKTTTMSLIFSTPNLDVSDMVLKKLGYSK